MNGSLFIVIDSRISQRITVKSLICSSPEWIRRLTYKAIYDLEFAITENGDLILKDTCGNYVYCPDYLEWQINIHK